MKQQNLNVQMYKCTNSRTLTFDHKIESSKIYSYNQQIISENFIYILSSGGSTDKNTFSHRYLNKSRLLKFCCVPATSAAFSNGIFVVATNSTNQTNMAGGTCHKSVYPS